MTQFQVLARRMAFAAAVACVFAGSLSAWPSLGEARKAKSEPQAAGPAQPGPSGPGAGNNEAQKVAETEAAKKAYDAGLKGYAAGRYKPAIEQLSIAVKSGKLSPPELAKALLTRGRAYKKDAQPGLAISDLTSAMWLKNGLSAGDQKAALEDRSDAYRMAGLADSGSSPDKRAIGTPTAPVASNVTANAAPGPNAGSAGLSAAAIAETASSQKAQASSDGTAATVRSTALNGETTLQSAAAPGVSGQQAQPASSGGGIGGFFGWGQSSAQAQAPPQPEATAAPSSGSSFTKTVTSIPGNVSGFFSNMFGGGSSAPAPEHAQGVTTASTTATAPETSSWSSATSVGTHAQRDDFRAEKASYSRDVPAKTAVLTKGKFKIHIAALRSRSAADALAKKLIAEHGAELGNHMPVVDSAVIGSMGTFYRVRIGGYASQSEPRSLCNKLRTSGLDCLVVTN